MPAAPLPPNEAARLAALRAYDVLDTAPEADFDGVARLAARLCDTRVALVSLLDEQRQWFKANVGLERAETPRDEAICGHAILAPRELLVVSDTHEDARTRDNPLCVTGPALRFYAGMPLLTPDGLPLGTLCVLDDAPRPDGLTPEQADSLRVLARQVEVLLEARRAAEREALLRREAVHRGKNVVGVVQALVSQTIHRARDLEHAAASVSRRLAALGSAYDLLRGGGDRVDLGTLVRVQLEAFDTGGRLRTEGPPLTLDARAAEGVGLALHELATNAAKYGALSVPEGRVAVRWSRQNDGGVALTWTEHGGPPPQGDAPRQDGGFGRTVIERVAAQAIGGSAGLDLAPSGARWTAEIDAKHVEFPAG